MSKTLEEINKACIERLKEVLPFAKEWYQFLKINNYTDETKDVLESIGMSDRLIEYIESHKTKSEPQNKSDDEFAKSEGFNDWEHSMRNMSDCGNEFLLSDFIEKYAKEQINELVEMLNKAKERLYTVESPSTSCRYIADEITELLTKYK